MSGGYYLTQRGRIALRMPGTRFYTASDALAALTERTGTDDADAWERDGWELVTVADGRVWDERERRELAAHARRMFTDHGHGSDWSRMARENCGACVLGGYEPRGGFGDGYRVRTDGPNYANWQRDYVESGRVIRESWRDVFVSSIRDTDNERWKECVIRSIRTFGVRIGNAAPVFDPAEFGV